MGEGQGGGRWRGQLGLCDTLNCPPIEPGWRNWQTQRTQNPPTLAVMGVRPPLPAPALNNPQISNLQTGKSFVPKLCLDCAQTVPNFPSPASGQCGFRSDFGLSGCSFSRTLFAHNLRTATRNSQSRELGSTDAGSVIHRRAPNHLMHALVMYSRRGCHLCDVAKETLTHA